MGKKSTSKITFDEFVAKATAKKNNKKLVTDIYVDDEFGKVTFSRPSNNDILQYINNVSKSLIFDKEGNMTGQDTVLMFEASRELVYATCPYLQNKELHQALDIVDPFDVVAEVFGVQNTIDLATRVKDTFDGDYIKDVVKN
jgi:hypothetical protein